MKVTAIKKLLTYSALYYIMLVYYKGGESVLKNKNYSYTEVCKILGVSRATLLRYIKANKVKGFKIGLRWNFPKEDIHKLINGE